MEIHSVSRPGLNPPEAEICEMDWGLNEISLDEVVLKKERDFPEQKRAKQNAEVNERSDVNLCKEYVPGPFTGSERPPEGNRCLLFFGGKSDLAGAVVIPATPAINCLFNTGKSVENQPVEREEDERVWFVVRPVLLVADRLYRKAYTFRSPGNWETTGVIFCWRLLVEVRWPCRRGFRRRRLPRLPVQRLFRWLCRFLQK